MEKNITIGICDDDSSIHIVLEKFCNDFFSEDFKISYVKFLDGNEIIDYCANPDNRTIQLLFLDIEMSGLNGIEALNILTQEKKIWRIAFVSSHLENVLETFSIKTIGFIPKPIDGARIDKILNSMMDEFRENILLEVSIGNRKETINCEDIVYLKAEGSYTKIYAKEFNNIKEYLSSKKLGELEKNLDNKIFIRTHKSYIVNAEYVSEVKQDILLNKLDANIPVGRKYKKDFDTKLKDYRLMRIRRRL